jgi:hypothetical protein
MNETAIAWALTLASIWTIAVLPMIVGAGVVKFMDIMRRRKDDLPW